MVAKNRRGAGLLIVLVCAILGILTPLFTHQALLNSQTSLESHVLLRGDRAELLASAAVQEAMAETQSQANDGRTGLFKLFRQMVLAPKTGSFDLSPAIKLAQSKALLQRLPKGTYVLAKPVVDVIVQKHLDHIVPYERQGYIKYESTVRSPARGRNRATKRTLELVQSFKTVLLNPPHPFCHFGFFVSDVSTMTDTLAINPNREALLNLLKLLRMGLKKSREQARGMAQEYDSLLEEIYDFKYASSLARRVPGTHSRKGACYGLYLNGEGREYDLSHLDLASRLYEKVQKIHSERKNLESKSMARLLSKGDVHAHKRVLKVARRVWFNIKEALDSVVTFNDNFTILPAIEKNGRPNKAFMQLQKSSCKLTKKYWQVRAHFKMSDQPHFDEFLRENRKPRGVVLVENTKTRLELKGHIEGQLIIIAGPAGVYLEDFNERANEKANITVVVPEGAVTVSGKNKCALIVGQKARLNMVSEARLEGTLIIARCPSSQNLNGTLKSDTAYFWDWQCVKFPGGDQDGLSLEKLFVGFSPKYRYRKVTR